MGKNRISLDEPCMSDLTILVSVEDLINMCMGPPMKNIVNYKLLQTVLHILARQLRLLETKVDIRISEQLSSSDSSSTSPSSSASRKRDKKDKKRRKSKFKELFTGDDRGEKVKEKDKLSGAELAEMKEKKAKEKAEKIALKEKSQEEKTTLKERGKEEKAAMKEKGKEEKLAAKEKATLKEKAKEEKAAIREKAKEDKAAIKEQGKEEKSAMKEKSKEKNADMKEKDKEKKSTQKEKEYAEKTAMIEKETERMSPKAKEKYLKEKEIKESESKNLSTREETKLKKKEARADTAQMTSDELDIQRKEEQALEKMSPSAKKLYKRQRELEKKQMEKMSPGEKEKYLKQKSKELKEMENMTSKEMENYIKDKGSDKQKMDRGSEINILVSEGHRNKEKVLIVEKTSRKPPARVGSIEVVTLSQFELLESTVQKLSRVAGPLPMPSLPDNKKLRTDLTRGSATLTETMEAMQISGRVLAAEKGINRLAGLLTQLASAGALPMEITAGLENVKAEMEDMMQEALHGESTSQIIRRSSLTTVTMSTKPSRGRIAEKMKGLPSTAVVSTVSKASSGTEMITKIEMEDAIRAFRADVLKNVDQITHKSALSADNAAGTVKGVADKFDIALRLNERINALSELTSDYAEQLSGLDAGCTTQMQSFQEQMSQIRSDLREGLNQLATASNNAETAAVLELRERFDQLAMELDGTVLTHHSLSDVQTQLGEDLRGLMQAVEMMREEKADRDEILDGLQDKADKSKLTGLMTEVAFMKAREELDKKLDLCYDKFRKQDCIWMRALKDLSEVAEGKADLIKLYTLKDQMQDALNDIDRRLGVLTSYLGQPKAAILTRTLSKNAACGACRVPALMEPEEVTYAKPVPLKALRPSEGPCVPEWHPPIVGDGDAEDMKVHMCRRWVGGSHTLLSSTAAPEEPDPLPEGVPIKKYAGYGSDGRIYMLEDELQPCAECKVFPGPAGERYHPTGAEDDTNCRDGQPQQSH